MRDRYSDYVTGWYGIPGGRTGGRVHIVSDGKPICGDHIHSKAEFQWCAPGVKYDYVECRRCLERYYGRHKAEIEAEAIAAYQRLKIDKVEISSRLSILRGQWNRRTD